MYIEPTAHHVDRERGLLTNAQGHYEKRLYDLDGLYADDASFQSARVSNGNAIVYEVTDQRPTASHGDLIFGVTRMSPGKIGDEYYMTRGHIHARANRPETYYGEAGNGVMLLETPDGDCRAIEINPGVIVYVPPLWIHRSVNVGADDLVMSFCYPSDSGQDYEVIAKQGGMRQRIVDDGNGGWRAINNADYRQRTQEEIDAILNTQDIGNS